MRKTKIYLYSLISLTLIAPPLFGQWKGFSSVTENIKASDGVITQLRLEWSGGTRQIKAQLHGTMELFAYKPTIKDISPGGSFVLEERNGKIYRKLIVGNNNKGKLDYRYEVQAEKAEFSSIARQWFESVLLEIVLEAGINSRQRAQAIYEQSGEQGILQEISQIERERSKRFYYERLLEFESVSDSTLFEVASRIREEFTADANLKIVITEMVAKHKLSANTLIAVLRAAKEVNNEVTRANLLVDIAAKLPKNQKVTAYYREVANSIGSDVERQRALSALK